ncbi:MAG: TlpA family protein disulfide reductase [Acidimicrobiales bacterium]
MSSNVDERAPDLDERDVPRRSHTGRWLAAVFAVVAVVFVAVLATRPSAQDLQAASPLLGHPAPALQGTGVDGTRVDLVAMRGRWVVVNFFASWCVTCHQEHPELVAFSQRHREAGDAAVIGVTFDDRPEDARRFLVSGGGHWPALVDGQGRVALDFGVRAPPESFLIDPNGIVVSKIVGGVTADGLDRLLRTAKTRGV